MTSPTGIDPEIRELLQELASDQGARLLRVTPQEVHASMIMNRLIASVRAAGSSVVGVLLFAAYSAGLGYKGNSCAGGVSTSGLNCIQGSCPEACSTQDVTVSLPNGGSTTGRICQCGSFGPYPNCCKVAIVPHGTGYAGVAYGDCDAAGCNTSGTCGTIQIWDGTTTIAYCYGIP
jgi:hypothetical protein